MSLRKSNVTKCICIVPVFNSRSLVVHVKRKVDVDVDVDETYKDIWGDLLKRNSFVPVIVLELP